MVPSVIGPPGLSKELKYIFMVLSVIGPPGLLKELKYIFVIIMSRVSKSRPLKAEVRQKGHICITSY